METRGNASTCISVNAIKYLKYMISELDLLGIENLLGNEDKPLKALQNHSNSTYYFKVLYITSWNRMMYVSPPWAVLFEIVKVGIWQSDEDW